MPPLSLNACCLLNAAFGNLESLLALNCVSTNTCILPIFIWCVVATSTLNVFDVLDNWCLRRILNIHWYEHYSQHGSSFENPSNSIIHVCRADSSQDHCRAFRASIVGLQRIGRGDVTWTVERRCTASAHRRAQNRSSWRSPADKPWMMMMINVNLRITRCSRFLISLLHFELQGQF